MKSIKDVSASFQKELSGLYDLNEINSLSMMAFTEVTGFSAAKIKAFPELQLTHEQESSIINIISQLKEGKPIQYVLGYAEFYGLKFKVNPSVLVPRPETEELVEWIVSSVSSLKLAVGNLLDIGTGSGCIAITLKKHLPEFSVLAIDISIEALQTAKENAILNQVGIDFIQADILSPKFDLEHSNFEIIASNPPYVTLEDKKQMHRNVTDYEPHTALFVPENDPLIFYKAIADFSSKNLEKGGLLFFEGNESYGEQIVELLIAKQFINIELKKDMSGKDRMIKAQFLG